MATQKRMSVYPSIPLMDLKNSSPDGQFSKRLSKHVERYQLLTKHGKGIALTELDQTIIKTACSGSFVEPMFIRCLADEIRNMDEFDQVYLDELARKVDEASIESLLVTLEKLGI